MATVKNTIYRDGELERVMTPGGFMARDTLMAYVADYQGNVRAVVDKTGAVREQNNYYPYGLLMPTPAVAAAPVPNDFQPFKYSAKELDRRHGLDLLDFGARLYDPAYSDHSLDLINEIIVTPSHNFDN
ncbi:MAG: hypothetical protein IJ835_01455 [Muribaculaceae bacterium]|nr:hypothetical protein [Muribaculaceae bacterium]